MNRRLRSITVAELIELLQGESPDSQVIFSTDYGDRCHTPQALPIEGMLELVTIRESAYSTSRYAIAEPDGDEPDDSAANDMYLVIR
jgi:hypothetical protein